MSLEPKRNGGRRLDNQFFIFYQIEKGKRWREWFILVAASAFAVRCISQRATRGDATNRFLTATRREHQKASAHDQAYSRSCFSPAGHESAALLQLVRHGHPG